MILNWILLLQKTLLGQLLNLEWGLKLNDIHVLQLIPHFDGHNVTIGVSHL